MRSQCQWECTRLRLSKGLRASDDSEPLWQLHGNPLEGDAPPRCAESIPIPRVPGAFLIKGVLSHSECEMLAGLTEHLGFTSGTSIVEVPRTVRTNDVAVVVVPPETCAALSSRLAPFVPRNGHGSATRTDPTFVNRRWRCYRYLGGDDAQRFGPHYDGAQPQSAVIDHSLVDDEPAKGVQRLSQMSILLYLNEPHCGGETIFYPNGDATRAADAVKVAPCTGAALCFWHGHHPLSPMHEGAPLQSEGASQTAAPKLVIRTDVMYATEALVQKGHEWSSSSYAAAMLHASSVWGQQSSEK